MNNYATESWKMVLFSVFDCVHRLICTGFIHRFHVHLKQTGTYYNLSAHFLRQRQHIYLDTDTTKQSIV